MRGKHRYNSMAIGMWLSCSTMPLSIHPSSKKMSTFSDGKDQNNNELGLSKKSLEISMIDSKSK